MNYDLDVLFTPEEIAVYLHIDIDIIYDLIYCGELQVVTVSDYNRFLIPKKSLERYIKANTKYLKILGG